MAVEVCGSCWTRYAVGARSCPQCGSPERAADGDPGLVPPVVTVACDTTACPRAGRAQRLMLRLAVPGVVELPTLLCAACGNDLTITWPAPEEPMPKITVHGGASNAAEETAAAAELDPPAAAAAPTEEETAAPEGSEKPPPKATAASRRKPTRKTE